MYIQHAFKETFTLFQRILHFDHLLLVQVKNQREKSTETKPKWFFYLASKSPFTICKDDSVEPHCDGSQGTNNFYLLLMEFVYCQYMK